MFNKFLNLDNDELWIPKEKGLYPEFTDEFYQTFKKAIIPVLFWRVETNRLVPNSFYEVSSTLTKTWQRHYKKGKL